MRTRVCDDVPEAMDRLAVQDGTQLGVVGAFFEERKRRRSLLFAVTSARKNHRIFPIRTANVNAFGATSPFRKIHWVLIHSVRQQVQFLKAIAK